MADTPEDDPLAHLTPSSSRLGRIIIGSSNLHYRNADAVVSSSSETEDLPIQPLAATAVTTPVNTGPLYEIEKTLKTSPLYNPNWGTMNATLDGTPVIVMQLRVDKHKPGSAELIEGLKENINQLDALKIAPGRSTNPDLLSVAFYAKNEEGAKLIQDLADRLTKANVRHINRRAGLHTKTDDNSPSAPGRR